MIGLSREPPTAVMWGLMPAASLAAGAPPRIRTRLGGDRPALASPRLP